MPTCCKPVCLLESFGGLPAAKTVGQNCRQVDEGGSTLEAGIMQRHSEANSSWGVLTDTSEIGPAIQASRVSQVSAFQTCYRGIL